MRIAKRLIPDIYLALLLIFIYLPIAILIIYSFNKLPKSFIWAASLSTTTRACLRVPTEAASSSLFWRRLK